MEKRRSITVTYAQSIDGRIATVTGDSRWISGNRTLRLAHRLRSSHDCILVGIGTVIRDDPELSCRLRGRPSPVRVIFDTSLSIPRDSKIVRTADSYRTLILTSESAPDEKRAFLEDRKISVITVAEERPGHIDIAKALECLSALGMNTVLVEGGSKIITSFISSGYVSRLVVVTAPLVIGEGTPSIGDLGVTRLQDALRLKTRRMRNLGRDLVWEFDFER